MKDLVQLSKEINGKLKSQNLIHPNVGAVSYRRMEIKDYKGFKIKVNEFESVYEITIAINSSNIWSINNIDEIVLIEKEIDIKEAFPYRIFISNINPFLSKPFLNFWADFAPMLIELKLDVNEMVVFYSNSISLIINQRRPVIEVLSGFLRLLTNHEDIFKKNPKKVRILSKNIPVKLRVLQPLFDKWAVSDDVEREQLIEEASNDQKSYLINTVNPLMKEINEFLDPFNEKTMSEEAIKIGQLAELVSEIDR